MAIKTRQPELNRRQEELGTGFLPWAYIHTTFPPFHQAWTWISPPTLNNNVTSSKPLHALVSLHFWHVHHRHPLHYWQHLPPLSTPLTPSSPHSLHFWHHFPHTLCTTDTTFSPHLHQISLYYGCPSCFHGLLTDDDAVRASKRLFNRYCKIKIVPPVSLLQT